ncbi:isopropylmalate isomerase small subunit [Pseudooceanicola batsensis HTCC2597]|uniref:3-isopropylmalate dehydratase small subunit n=1 Tax=Pseudooceanicola batsensis (strain ATCC BAA-863 / DSM 15984 / KCTC 12145 / HTCC2597) TaxID=252305 RepID=A3U0C0_PSEBH|nr:3-isopropylmalate dehydratase small subunit [Pseudooceanicola batsensis]EAQ02211.1 isopropylmalate isomerase small subunit [Pseudooceanicola batsensis HTCC2597]
MDKFTSLTSLAAPLLENAIDTDIIFPARFLLLLDREGLGKHAFNEWRGPGFVLDTPPYDKAQILVTGENFGTGSSREQAVWTLADLGIRCVIARSFGEIFYSNCFKNGVLPIRLTGTEMEAVESAAEAQTPLTVDLESKTVSLPDGQVIPFDIADHHRRALLAGLDEVGMILADHSQTIAEFEERRRTATPWLDLSQDKLDALAEDGA